MTTNTVRNFSPHSYLGWQLFVQVVLMLTMAWRLFAESELGCAKEKQQNIMKRVMEDRLINDFYLFVRLMGTVIAIYFYPGVNGRLPNWLIPCLKWVVYHLAQPPSEATAVTKNTFQSRSDGSNGANLAKIWRNSTTPHVCSPSRTQKNTLMWQEFS